MSSVIHRAFWVAVLAISMLAGCGGSSGSGVPPHQPLNQPLNPVVRVYSAQEVRLSWTDNSANEDGFIIERSLDNVTFTEVGRVGTDAVTFTDMSTANNQMLYYRVATYQGTNVSTYSDRVHAFHYYFDACVSSPVVQNTSSGKLYPLTISGLNYSSDYHSSVTDTNSSFGFDANANTRFSIGYIPIANISAKAFTSTNDLVAGISLGTSSAANAEMNILRLLLALDGDANNTNGIQLPCNLSTASGDIDFTLDETAFANQADVIRLLNGNVLPTQAQALTQFQNARNRYYSGNYRVSYFNLFQGFIVVASGHIDFTINVDGTVTVTAFVDDSSSSNLDTASFLPDSAQNLYFQGSRSDVLYSDLKINANIDPSYAITGRFELNGLLKLSDDVSGFKR
ncbi:MAG: hypothetical protein KKH12_10135 [Gammaproteobacteria bacterium]|nr:hypothetical protein [Gammaproteobacteria bacterium]MBU1482020.1 hypothetical protein [Gammaproteobacteria bacterium]